MKTNKNYLAWSKSCQKHTLGRVPEDLTDVAFFNFTVIFQFSTIKC